MLPLSYDNETSTIGSDDRDLQGRATRRRPGMWDLAGLLATASVGLVLVALAPLVAGHWFYGSRPLVAVALACCVSAGAAVFGARRRDPAMPLACGLLQVWRQPPGGWAAFVLGTIVSLPVLGLYTPGLGADADSMRLIANIHHVQRGNLDFLVETQDSIGPHILLGPALLVGGAGAARLVTILSMQLLVAVVAWLTYRISSSMTAALASALAMLAIGPFVARASTLPMYPAMLAFGALGVWLSYRVVAERAGWGYAFGAGALLVLAMETQSVGQLLLASPLLLVLTASDWRQGLRGAGRVIAATAVILVPRIVVNLSAGGLHHVRSNRTDYWITEGYLRQIQENWWDYSGVGESFTTYLAWFPQRFAASLGAPGWAALALALIALVGIRGRPRRFAVAFFLLIATAMAIRTIQPNARYFSLLWPGLAVVAGVGVATLLRDRRRAQHAIGIGAVALLVGCGVYNLRDTGIDGRARASVAERQGFTDAVAAIDDDRGVIGVRSHVLIAADVDLRTYGGHLLSEEEYVTYLTWPSDEAVIEILEHHDIGWVMTTKQRRLDHNYNNVWLVPAYGQPARHLDMLRESPNFCRLDIDARVTIYKLGGCPD